MNKRRKVQASQANDEDDACRTNFIGKSGRRHLRGRKISSACFANLPLDILFEIFVYLQPIDLLHLARTSKGLRNLLMSRTAEPIWRDAAENVTACPTRPPDVNEPTWTSLVFDTYCHTKGCSKTGIKEPLWHFRKRYCNACKLACTVPVEQAVIRKRAVEEVEQLPLPSCTVSMEVNGHREYIRSVHKPDLVKMKETYHRLNPRKRVQWLGEKAAEAEDIQIHADWCHRWSRNNKCRREEELENIRAEKYEAILANLTQLGWGPEVDFMAQESLFSDTLRRISIVKQAKPLTDRSK
ncbi:hypothetical protein K474DRAFT_1651392 [Panus rudis PR-1116 ss-1]|nr:hypothetical protein K474DRAFT_1651392 [Panus rudis PR-1116 ss-1]